MPKNGKARKRNAHDPQRQLIALRKRLGVPSLNEVRWNLIQKALRATNNDVVLAAALMGIGKTTLYRYLNQRR